MSEETDEDTPESSNSSYPTFASYRQAQHANFDAFAQRMRRALEAAAAAAAAASDDACPAEEEASSFPGQSIPDPTTTTSQRLCTNDTNTLQPSQPQPPRNN